MALPSLKGYAWKGKDFPINQDMSELQGTSGIIWFSPQIAELSGITKTRRTQVF